MKVVILSSSDSTGGAAVVTRRLMHALKTEGVDVKMIVNSRLSDDNDIDWGSSRSVHSFLFLKERIGIYLNNGFSRSNLFKVSTASCGSDVTSHPWVKEADVVLLSWINQGFISLKGIERIAAMGKPIVWMMHDMWCLTGICHHANDCGRYCEHCGCCPLLKSSRPHDLSYRTWLRKKALYSKIDIKFVAVSNWLAAKCRESSLMQDMDVRVIHNPFPIASFHYETQKEMHVTMLDYNKDTILMGAARLDDPIKGLDYAIDALNILFDEHPELTTTTEAVFFGAIRDRSKLDRLNFPALLTGTISDPKVLREMYAASRIVLSTSLYETLPGTLIEGQAAGALPVTFGMGGQADIVDHKVNGYIADYKNPRSIADGILWALGHKTDRRALHESVRERFSASTIANKYIDLFNQLLSHK